MSWESIGHELQRQPEPTEHLNKNQTKKKIASISWHPKTNRASQQKPKEKENYPIFWLPEPTEHDRTPQQEAKAKPP